MKKSIFLFLTLLLNTYTYSQGQNWKLNGNTISNSDYLGTNNNESLRFKSNGTEWMSISPTGKYIFNSLADVTNGVLGIRSNGEMYRINYTGNSTDVFLGNGTFGNLSALTGWSILGNVLYADPSKNVAIGGVTAQEKLTVDGNILANGSITGTSLTVANIVTSGREFKISTSLCLKGIDQNVPGSKNEICGLNGDLYVQSMNNNYNTIFNYGNTGKIGFGIIPSERFHVGVDAKFEGKVIMDRISLTDSLFAIGDSSVYVYPAYNQIFGSDNTFMKGIALGRYSYPKGLNSITLGRRIRADGNNSMIIGSTTPGNSDMLVNAIDNSLMIGFESDIPTFFVSAATGGNGTTGAVGIGTSYIPANYKLAVNGNIIAEEVFVKLRNGWPDYVFDSSYERMSLLEKEKYIAEHKHLPGIASATEIEKTGIPTGEVMRGMTQNLEENSLEIIELYKMFEELKKENEALKKKVEELENK